MSIPHFKGELEVAGKLVPFFGLGPDVELQRLWRYPDIRRNESVNTATQHLDSCALLPGWQVRQ